MPNIKSAKKRVKVIEKKTLRNNMIKSGYKSAVKKFEQAIEAGNIEEAKKMYEYFVYDSVYLFNIKLWIRLINQNDFVSEFVITGGSQVPLDGDFAFSLEDVKAGVIAKRERVMAAKNSKAAQKKTPAPAEKSSKNGLDLGF